MAFISGPSSSNGPGPYTFQQTIDAIAANAPLPGQEGPIQAADLSCSKPSDDRLRIILTALAANTSLRSLNLRGNHIGKFPEVEVDSLDSLLKHKSITSLDLSHNHLGSGPHAILAQLMGSDTLKFLNLSHNGLAQGNLFAIGEGTLTRATLASLNLDNNPLEDFAGWVAGSLRENTSLTSLSLRGCDFASTGLRGIGGCLEINRTLRHVILYSPLVYANNEETSVLSRMGMMPGGVLQELVSSEIPGVCRRICERTLENERLYNRTLKLEERSFRNLVKPVYTQLTETKKRAVEHHIWINFNSPADPHSEFGRSHVFTSFEKFVASVKGAGVDMAAEMAAYYSRPECNPRGIDLHTMQDWALAVFNDRL